MWGALYLWLKKCLVGRIIPTYVGSTGNDRTITGRIKDHPYVCEEHLLLIVVSWSP